MRKIMFWMLTMLSCAVCSCSSDSTEPTSAFSGGPDASASENSKSGGVYKGVIVGSSGTFAVVLQNGIKRIRVTMDGEARDLTTASLDSWVSGDPLKNVLFEADGWQATFSVGATGNQPSINFTIPGHTDLQVVVVKELSSAQVRAFEGTYTGTSSGTWNFIVQGPALTGVSRSADGGSSLAFYGLVNGTSITLDGVSGSGSISGDNVSGSWSDSGSGGSGTWSGKRSM